MIFSPINIGPIRLYHSAGPTGLDESGDRPEDTGRYCLYRARDESLGSPLVNITWTPDMSCWGLSQGRWQVVMAHGGAKPWTHLADTLLLSDAWLVAIREILRIREAKAAAMDSPPGPEVGACFLNVPMEPQP